MDEAKAADPLGELLSKFVADGCLPDGAEIDDVEASSHGEGHHGHSGGESVRVVQYRGHEIRVKTHYEVTIDGEPWQRPMQVMPDGSVVSHALPQYVVPSALDLVRAVIDQGYEAPAEIRAAVARAEGDEGGEG